MRRKAKPAEPKPQPKPAKKPSPARATVKTEGKQQGARASGGKAKVTVVPKADTKKKAPAKAGGGGGGGGNPNWGPKAPPLAGMKHIPRGAPGCLRGKSFLVSGTLESLDRQDAFALIEKYGGSIIKSVPKKKKLDYAVIGEEAGQSKLKQLEDRNIPQIDENGLLTLIRDSLPPDERAKEPEVGDLKEDMELEGGLASAGGVKKPRAAAAAARPSPSSAAAPAAAAAAPKPPPPDPKHLLWTEKHKPRTHKDLIGNFNRALDSPRPRGPCLTSRRVAVINKLNGWLKKWDPGVIQAQGYPDQRAALLAGPPGYGKTSMAHVMLNEIGFDVMEFNASDVRSKKAVGNRVKQITNSRCAPQIFASSSCSELTLRAFSRQIDERIRLGTEESGINYGRGGRHVLWRPGRHAGVRSHGF